MSVAALIEAVVDKRPTDAADVFTDLIHARVIEAIDARRVAVAESLLTGEDPGDIDFDTFVWPDDDDDDLPLEFELDDEDAEVFVEWLNSIAGDSELIEKVLWTDRTGAETEQDAKENLPRDHPVNKAIRQNGGAKYGSAGRHHDAEEGDHDGVHVELKNGRHMSAIVHHRSNGPPIVKVKIHDTEQEARSHISDHIDHIHEGVDESSQGARNIGSMRPASRFRAAGAGKKPRKDFDRHKREIQEEGRKPFLELSESLKDDEVHDGYHVVNHDFKLTHKAPFKDSKSAIRHADALETKSGRTHVVFHVKGGKIQKQWHFTDRAQGFEPHTDYKGEDFRHYGHVNEETIDEVSKGLLGRYVKKASGDISSREISQHVYKPGNKAEWDHWRKFSTKTRRRKDGLETAVDRLTREGVEPIQEVSKGLLGRYIKAGSGDIVDRVRDADDHAKYDHPTSVKASRYQFNRALKRQKHVDKAIDRLTKEELESIDEISSAAKKRYLAGVDNPDNRGSVHSLVDIAATRDNRGLSGARHWKKYERRANIANKVEAGLKETAEPIQELSKKTLGRYIHLASIQKSGDAESVGFENGVGYSGHHPDRAYQDKANKRHVKRSLGIQNATNKLVGSDPWSR
jgi:hypothetical protein